jgi:hypothetical protein
VWSFLQRSPGKHWLFSVKLPENVAIISKRTRARAPSDRGCRPQAKTLTISKLMTIAPEGVSDPAPFIYGARAANRVHSLTLEPA